MSMLRPVGALLIPRVTIAGLRFGQLIALRQSPPDLQRRLFYITNEELQWHVDVLLKELT